MPEVSNLKSCSVQKEPHPAAWHWMSSDQWPAPAWSEQQRSIFETNFNSISFLPLCCVCTLFFRGNAPIKMQMEPLLSRNYFRASRSSWQPASLLPGFHVRLCVCRPLLQNVFTVSLQFFTFLVYWCLRNSCSSLHVWGFERFIPEWHWNSNWQLQAFSKQAMSIDVTLCAKCVFSQWEVGTAAHIHRHLQSRT